MIGLSFFDTAQECDGLMLRETCWLCHKYSKYSKHLYALCL